MSCYPKKSSKTEFFPSWGNSLISRTFSASVRKCVPWGIHIVFVKLRRPNSTLHKKDWQLCLLHSRKPSGMVYAQDFFCCKEQKLHSNQVEQNWECGDNRKVSGYQAQRDPGALLMALGISPSLSLFFKDLFMYLRERAWAGGGRVRGRRRESLKQTPRWAQTLTQLNPMTLRSQLELKPGVGCLTDWATRVPRTLSLFQLFLLLLCRLHSLR